MPRALIPPTPERAAAEDDVRERLSARDFEGAARVVSAFEAKQERPRGMGIDWATYTSANEIIALAAMYSYVPQILRGILPEAVEPLRLAAAMQLLWGQQKRRWLPIDLPTGTHLRADAAARMFMFYGYSQRDIAGWQSLVKSGMITELKVSAIFDACPACQAIAGRTFDARMPPEFPNPTCTSEKGCRCSLMPEL